MLKRESYADQYVLVPLNQLQQPQYHYEPQAPKKKKKKPKKPKEDRGNVVVLVIRGVYNAHKYGYKILWDCGKPGKVIAIVVALAEVAVLHMIVAESKATDAETKACNDAGHQMMQVGSTNRLIDTFKSINLKSNIAETLSATRGYTVSVTRLVQTNPGLFDSRDTHGPQCVNVPGPIPYGFSEANGKDTIRDYRKYEWLSADEFAQLNPGMPKADDYVPAAGSVVKWSKHYDVSLALTTAPKTLGEMVHSKHKQSKVRHLVDLNFIPLGHGGRIIKGEPAYLPMKQTTFERRNGIEVSDIVAEYNESYLHMPKTQRVQPKQIVPPRKHTKRHHSHRPVRIHRIVNGVKIPELQHLSKFQSVKATTALAELPGWHNRAIAMRRLMDDGGLADFQAAALVGGFMTESASVELDPSRLQFNGGPGRGLAQWEGGRRDALFAFAESHSQPWDSLELQIAFVIYELNGSEHTAGNWIRNTTGLAGAADAVLNGYERPAERYVTPRLQNAADVLTEYYKAAGK